MPEFTDRICLRNLILFCLKDRGFKQRKNVFVRSCFGRVSSCMKDKDKQFMRNSKDSTRQSKDNLQECPNHWSLLFLTNAPNHCIRNIKHIVNANYTNTFKGRKIDE